MYCCQGFSCGIGSIHEKNRYTLDSSFSTCWNQVGIQCVCCLHHILLTAKSKHQVQNESVTDKRVLNASRRENLETLEGYILHVGLPKFDGCLSANSWCQAPPAKAGALPTLSSNLLTSWFYMKKVLLSPWLAMGQDKHWSLVAGSTATTVGSSEQEQRLEDLWRLWHDRAVYRSLIYFQICVVWMSCLFRSECLARCLCEMWRENLCNAHKRPNWIQLVSTFSISISCTGTCPSPWTVRRPSPAFHGVFFNFVNFHAARKLEVEVYLDFRNFLRNSGAGTYSWNGRSGISRKRVLSSPSDYWVGQYGDGAGFVCLTKSHFHRSDPAVTNEASWAKSKIPVAEIVRHPCISLYCYWSGLSIYVRHKQAFQISLRRYRIWSGCICLVSFTILENGPRMKGEGVRRIRNGCCSYHQYS